MGLQCSSVREFLPSMCNRFPAPQKKYEEKGKGRKEEKGEGQKKGKEVESRRGWIDEGMVERVHMQDGKKG